VNSQPKFQEQQCSPRFVRQTSETWWYVPVRRFRKSHC